MYILNKFAERKSGGPYTIPQLIEAIKDGKVDFEEDDNFPENLFAKADSNEINNHYSFFEFFDDMPTPKQRAYMRLLGFNDTFSVTRDEASTIIEHYKEYGQRNEEKSWDELLVSILKLVFELSC